MSSYKNSLNFRMSLAQAREQKLLQASGTGLTDKLHEDLISEYAREVKDLRSLLETNPALAERHARVKELESKMTFGSLKPMLETIKSQQELVVASLQGEISLL